MFVGAYTCTERRYGVETIEFEPNKRKLENLVVSIRSSSYSTTDI